MEVKKIIGVQLNEEEKEACKVIATMFGRMLMDGDEEDFAEYLCNQLLDDNNVAEYIYTENCESSIADLAEIFEKLSETT